MKTVLGFLTILHILLLAACSQGTPPNHENTIERPSSKEVEEKTITKKEKRVKKPNTENVRQFFLEYAENNPSSTVRLKTRLGDIDIKLYDDTPIHKGNFLYNINEELYHQTIFYRVVPDFMIQGGNSDNDQTLEKREKEAAYYIPNECKLEHIHKRGAVAMAMSYDDNPEKKSAQYSYYIVLGTHFSMKADWMLWRRNTESKFRRTVVKIYSSIGGTPHLDGVHTVFGEVIKGLDIVEAISNEKRDSGDWPINDVVIECEVLD